jgi:hypothetical protein
MALFRLTGIAMTCVAGLFGCGSEVSSNGGDSGPTSDATQAETSAREGGSDGPQLVDTGHDGDSGADSASCVPIGIDAAGVDSGSGDAGKMTTCDPDPCAPNQFCVAWENMPHEMYGVPYAQCVDLPADLPQCAITTCSPAITCACAADFEGRYGCGEKSCEENGGAVILTCYFAPPP